MRRPVNFYAESLRLEGILFLPEGHQPGQLLPGVVICHGFTQHKEIFGLRYAETLARHGFACLSFDYRGFGGSEGQRGRLIPLGEAEDCRSALTFLETCPEVDPQRLGLLGTSFGGAVVLYVAALDRRAKAVVSMDGFGDGWRRLRGERNEEEWYRFIARLEADRRRRVLTGQSEYVDYDDLRPSDPEGLRVREERRRQYPDWQYMLPLETAEKMMEFRPEQFVDSIAPRATMVIYAANRARPREGPAHDNEEEARAIYEKAGEPKKLFELPAPERMYAHYFGEALENWIAAAAQWFQTYLL